MTFIEIMWIFIIHFVADFVFQDENWAVNKSKSFHALLAHTMTYAAVWMGFGIIFTPFVTIPAIDWFMFIFSFSLITFTLHTITDYFTSKVTSSLYAKGKYGSSIPNLGFFSMIGFDQVLHYLQLFGTYFILGTWL